ncbi:virion protein G52 [Colobine gammaherpesvirus 1]|uniref:Virion protein G52 n=1 Tax=Colobine gammaherpesvirus 1 TaxID=2597325 RepID=A0A5B8G6L3_9GAMA|nr:virion protein G52 [Colobine gammaherpesvirus 1]QDQ69259.1 virion protein G52 [Colobine gammaherpesvirus 1]
MASSRRRQKPEATVEELTAQISQLSMENKQLRKALGAVADPADRPISRAEKEARLVATVSAMSAVASKKIEARVRTAVEKCVTAAQLEATLSNLHLRIDISTADASGAVTQEAQAAATNRRRRTASRNRRDAND